MLRHLCPSGTVAIILGMAYMCSVTFGTVEAKARAVPCPNEEDISPCVCTAYPDFSMDMDCSAVTSSNELALAFNAEFPFLDFNNLFIRNNTYITTLRVGDLGQATFQRITISDGGLKTVVDRALVNSYGTLLVLDLSGNALIDFPFDEISLFTYLDQLDFQNNKISSFPHLYSTSLSILQMGYNPLQTIGSSSLKNLPNLKEISLISAQLTSMDPGTLYGLGNLQVVHLEYNSLTMLLANTIQVTGPSNIVHLNNNLLANIEVNAIEGANFQVWIHDNKLTKLPEDVWQPMFDANIRLSARNNNITCDCEIAWIVLDANNLAHLADNPTCASGEPILELDTSLFLELCT